MIEASSSFLVRDIARCSSISERALSSFSLLRRAFSRRSSSLCVIRCNRREVEQEGVLWVINRDTLPFGTAVSTRLRFCRRAGSVSGAATVVLRFSEMDLRWEKIEGIPWRFLSLDDLLVVTVGDSLLLGMKAIEEVVSKWQAAGSQSRDAYVMWLVTVTSRYPVPPLPGINLLLL